MRISDWSSDVCSSDLAVHGVQRASDHQGAVEEEESGRLPRLPPVPDLIQRGSIAAGQIKAGVGHRNRRIGNARVEAGKAGGVAQEGDGVGDRSAEHTSELQSLMRISYAVFCLKKKTTQRQDARESKETKKEIKNIIRE